MKPKLFINFGLPKTSSTNLQSNFYPFIKNINYLGRVQGSGLQNNPILFKELNLFVEGGKNNKFSDKRLEDLKKSLKKNLTKEINLISMENWAFPYQRNLISNKIEITSQFEKLARLKKFIEELDIDYHFFVIHRKQVEGIVSLFVTSQNRIEKVFGPKYLSFNEFLSKYESKDKDYNNLKLFFDVYNIEKIKEIFQDDKLKIFDYFDIKNNPKKFITEFYNYLGLKIDHLLLKNIIRKTGITPLRQGNYFVKTPNSLFKLIKNLMPKFLKKKLAFFGSLKIFNKLFIKDYVITNEDVKKLTLILDKERQ